MKTLLGITFEKSYAISLYPKRIKLSIHFYWSGMVAKLALLGIINAITV